MPSSFSPLELFPVGFRPEEIGGQINENVVKQHAERVARLWSARDAPDSRDLFEPHLDGIRAALAQGWKLPESLQPLEGLMSALDSSSPLGDLGCANTEALRSGELVIQAAGLVSAVGFNGSACLAAMHAGLTDFKPSGLWDDMSGTYLNAGKAYLPQWWNGRGKLAELVAPAIQQCLVAARPVMCEDIPLLLGVSETDRPGRFEGLESTLLYEIASKLQLSLHPASETIAEGNLAVVGALAQAAVLLQEGVPACVVAGVDSLVRQATLAGTVPLWTDNDGYLKANRVRTPNNAEGFIPAEAGAALLVTPAYEPAPRDSHLVVAGLAHPRAAPVVQVVDEVLAGAQICAESVAVQVSDWNGESFKSADESAVRGQLGQRATRWRPAESLGEVGAAVGPSALAWLLYAARKRLMAGPIGLCHLSGFDGRRAAVAVRVVAGTGK